MGILDGTIFDHSEDIIVSFLHQHIHLAPALLLSLEEMGIPLPIPGDIIIAYLGYQVSKNVIPYPIAFVTLLLSILVGASILYYLSYHYGEMLIEKFGKFIHLDMKKVAIVEKKFKQYGPLVIIFGRHIPGFRVPITIFAGISKVKYSTFIVSVFISVIFWIPFYLAVGRRLGPRTMRLLHVSHNYFLVAVIPIAAIILLYIFLRRRTKKKQ